MSAGRKDDGFDGDGPMKPRWDLLFSRALSSVVDVLTYGARKYGPENWRKVPDARRRYFRAAIGHVVAWWGGERIDGDSGLPHLAHAVTCLLFLLELDEGGEPGVQFDEALARRAEPAVTATASGKAVA